MTAADFFRDTPWLNVPNERRGNIMVESLYPRGGLLGGSGEPAKPSKLAALAAARKKAQEDKKTASVDASGAKEPGTSVSLLEKLSIRPKKEVASSKQSGPSDDLKRKLSTSSSREAPARGISRLKPQEETVIEAVVEPKTQLPEKQPVAAVPDLRAAPSTFARTMLGSTHNPPPVTEDSMISLPYPRLAAATDRNPFAGPSPDDVVLNAQTKGSKRG